ncbi:hypothetical protein R3P38DRAFT_3219853 [Favolaschia claudopus]|uniref:Uncharacterized protein n=1 Tax=Favolaschia claudopus TaxID=2862362 RepID=A0AAW0A2E1_9AGAR
MFSELSPYLLSSRPSGEHPPYESKKCLKHPSTQTAFNDNLKLLLIGLAPLQATRAWVDLMINPATVLALRPLNCSPPLLHKSTSRYQNGTAKNAPCSLTSSPPLLPSASLETEHFSSPPCSTFTAVGEIAVTCGEGTPTSPPILMSLLRHGCHNFNVQVRTTPRLAFHATTLPSPSDLRYLSMSTPSLSFVYALALCSLSVYLLFFLLTPFSNSPAPIVYHLSANEPTCCRARFCALLDLPRRLVSFSHTPAPTPALCASASAQTDFNAVVIFVKPGMNYVPQAARSLPR